MKPFCPGVFHRRTVLASVPLKTTMTLEISKLSLWDHLSFPEPIAMKTVFQYFPPFSHASLNELPDSLAL